MQMQQRKPLGSGAWTVPATLSSASKTSSSASLKRFSQPSTGWCASTSSKSQVLGNPSFRTLIGCPSPQRRLCAKLDGSLELRRSVQQIHMPSHMRASLRAHSIVELSSHHEDWMARICKGRKLAAPGPNFRNLTDCPRMRHLQCAKLDGSLELLSSVKQTDGPSQLMVSLRARHLGISSSS